MWSEINGANGDNVDELVNQTPCVLVTDAKALYDAAQGDRPDGGSTGGQVHGVAGFLSKITKGYCTPISLIGWNTSKLPGIARSSLAAEIQSMGIGEDESYLVRLQCGAKSTAPMATMLMNWPTRHHVYY